MKNNKFSWDKTFKYMKKCNFQNFKIVMSSTNKKSIEKLTKIFLTKKVIKLQVHSSSGFKYILKSLSRG